MTICMFNNFMDYLVLIDSQKEKEICIDIPTQKKQHFAFFFQNRKLMPKFVVKEMESLYLEELKTSINLLMANLESLPVSKCSQEGKYGLQKLRKYNHR